MKLKSVTIRSFRGFGRELCFDLGNTNIFAGPNGFGKTSFFDAVQWCLFGEVPRLSGSRDFSRAGDVLQNKFSAEPYFVAVEFESDGGDRLYRKRTSGTCISEFNGNRVNDRAFLQQLGLEMDGQDRFLRYFMLQQEKVNEFVRDLNPRGRYDAMISLLQFSTPDKLSERLGSLREQMEVVAARTNSQLREADSRLDTLRRDIRTLAEAKSELSDEVIARSYDSFLADSTAVRRALGFGELRGSTEGIPRLPELAEHMDATLRELRQLKSTTANMQILKDQAFAAPQDTDAKLGVINQEIEDLRKQKAELHASADVATNQLEAAQRLSEAEQRTLQHFQSVLAEVKALINTDSCPVCKRPIKRESLLSIVDSEIGRQAQQITDSINQRNNLQRELVEIQTKEKKVANELETRVAEQVRLHEYRDTLRQFNTQWGNIVHAQVVTRFAIATETFEQLVASLQTVEVEVAALHQRALDLVQLAQRLENATKLLPERNGELTRVEEERGRSLKSQQFWTSIENMFTRCSAAVSNTRTNLVTEMLEMNKPLIRNLYSRLHPHPLFSDIDFEIVKAYKEAELYFRVLSRDHTVVGYPSTIFSGSQLNALAVCIFVALSLRSAGALKLLLLDDPIQSMDDINVLGFCDVLRQLKRQRQLFVSTHNRSFYRLLLSKLRPANIDDRVRGFRFEGWSSVGPQIREEDVEFVDIRVQLDEMSSIIATSPA